MNIDVYDTYVQTADGEQLHFDVLLPHGDGIKARQYAYQWLLSIGRNPQRAYLEKCQYCHTEGASEAVQRQIRELGYSIIQMEGCPDSITS